MDLGWEKDMEKTKMFQNHKTPSTCTLLNLTFFLKNRSINDQIKGAHLRQKLSFIAILNLFVVKVIAGNVQICVLLSKKDFCISLYHTFVNIPALLLKTH
jgi:hypothetical protein